MRVAAQTVDNPSPMRPSLDTHGGIVKGGGYAPLHVQSLPKWELFREFPFWRFKLSTLCRQLEQPPLAGGCFFVDGCHGIRTRVRRGGRPRPPADTDEGRRNGTPGAPSPAGRCGITGVVRRQREGQAPPLRGGCEISGAVRICGTSRTPSPTGWCKKQARCVTAGG